MITTNSRNYWKKIWSLKDHGKSFDLVHNSKFKNNKKGFWNKCKDDRNSKNLQSYVSGK